jgi:hypothetical protein
VHACERTGAQAARVRGDGLRNRLHSDLAHDRAVRVPQHGHKWAQRLVLLTRQQQDLSFESSTGQPGKYRTAREAQDSQGDTRQPGMQHAPLGMSSMRLHAERVRRACVQGDVRGVCAGEPEQAHARARAWCVKQASSARCESSLAASARRWPTAKIDTRASGWQAADTRCGASAAQRRAQTRRMRPRLSKAASTSRASEYTLGVCQARRGG